MKIIKIAAVTLISIIVLFLVVALFLPSTMHVERSIEINKPVSEVYVQVADFNNWLKWNPWTEMEPSSKNWVTGTPGQPGSAWSWKGEKVGEGSMIMEEVKENEALKTKLVFKEPMEDDAKCDWKFTSTDKGTKVTWSFDDTADYPMGRVVGLFMDKMLGADFAKGLSNLKKISEGK